MITTFLSIILAQAGATATIAPVRMDGSCEYPENIRQRQNEAVLAICSRLTISVDVNETVFDFGPRSLGPNLKFAGSIEGSEMDVRSVTLRNGRKLAANGKCEIFYTSEEISVVSCLASAAGQAYVANFVPLRL